MRVAMWGTMIQACSYQVRACSFGFVVSRVLRDCCDKAHRTLQEQGAETCDLLKRKGE